MTLALHCLMKGRAGLFEFPFAVVFQLLIFLRWSNPFMLPVWPPQAFEFITFNICPFGHNLEKPSVFIN